MLEISNIFFYQAASESSTQTNVMGFLFHNPFILIAMHTKTAFVCLLWCQPCFKSRNPPS